MFDIYFLKPWKKSHPDLMLHSLPSFQWRKSHHGVYPNIRSLPRRATRPPRDVNRTLVIVPQLQHTRENISNETSTFSEARVNTRSLCLRSLSPCGPPAPRQMRRCRDQSPKVTKLTPRNQPSLAQSRAVQTAILKKLLPGTDSPSPDPLVASYYTSVSQWNQLWSRTHPTELTNRITQNCMRNDLLNEWEIDCYVIEVYLNWLHFLSLLKPVRKLKHLKANKSVNFWPCSSQWRICWLCTVF